MSISSASILFEYVPFIRLMIHESDMPLCSLKISVILYNINVILSSLAFEKYPKAKNNFLNIHMIIHDRMLSKLLQLEFAALLQCLCQQQPDNS